MEDPEWLQKAGLLLASAGLRAQNYELGLEAIDAVLAEHPDDADALLMQANLMIALRSRFEEGRRLSVRRQYSLANWTRRCQDSWPNSCADSGFVMVMRELGGGGEAAAGGGEATSPQSYSKPPTHLEVAAS